MSSSLAHLILAFVTLSVGCASAPDVATSSLCVLPEAAEAGENLMGALKEREVLQKKLANREPIEAEDLDSSFELITNIANVAMCMEKVNGDHKRNDTPSDGGSPTVAVGPEKSHRY
jgi:hypothetical protein